MKKIILASKSHARRTILENAGLNIECIPADIDEDAVKDKMLSQGSGPAEIAQQLAIEKAKKISYDHESALVIGADQVLEFEGAILSKAATAKDAQMKLEKLNGKIHYLHAAISVVQKGENQFNHVESAQLCMKTLRPEELEAYCKKAGEALTRSVGAYELEKTGAWLFSDVKGDYFTVLGMPLLPLLDYLMRIQGVTPWELKT